MVDPQKFLQSSPSVRCFECLVYDRNIVDPNLIDICKVKYVWIIKSQHLKFNLPLYQKQNLKPYFPLAKKKIFRRVAAKIKVDRFTGTTCIILALVKFGLS